MPDSLIYSADMPLKAGASVGDDPLSQYKQMLKWMSETEAKLPDGSVFKITPQMREDAFNIDPILSGMVVPYKMNTLLSIGNLKTKDNKRHEAAIDEIEGFHKRIGTLAALRQGFEDYVSKHGKMFVRCEPSFDELMSSDARLVYLDNKTIKIYRDPFDSTKVAYHQKIMIPTTWTENASTKEVNTWWIPTIDSGSGWVEEAGDSLADEVYQEFQKYIKQYTITDVANLRIASTKDLIVLEKKKAPIDRCLLAIWLKRLMLTQSPNIIYRVLAPIIHMTTGKPLEIIVNGQVQKIPMAPPVPDESIKNTSPEKYQEQKRIRDNYELMVQTAASNLLKCVKEGGVFITQPDTELQILESGRTVPSNFIKQMIDLNDEEIGQAHGFPISLIKANGSELATSRSINEVYTKTTYGEKIDFEAVFDKITDYFFKDKTWSYSIEKTDGTLDKGSYSYAEMKSQWELVIPDNKDLLTEAQTFKTKVESVAVIKKDMGASKADVQALLDEEIGVGILDLDNFDTAPPDATPGLNTSTTVTSADVGDDLEPSGITKEDVPLAKQLLNTYKKLTTMEDKLLGLVNDT